MIWKIFLLIYFCIDAFPCINKDSFYEFINNIIFKLSKHTTYSFTWLIQRFVGRTSKSIPTLERGLFNLFNHPNIIRKVVAGLDAHVGQQRLLDKSDL